MKQAGGGKSAGAGLAILVLALLLAGCAGPAAQAVNDPFEPTNRAIFGLNQWWGRCCLTPTLERYRDWVPEGGQRGIHNFLGNLDDPITFVNDIAQGELDRSEVTAGRFLINSTLGIGGFFDPARRMGLEPHSEDVGQTLAVWGMSPGPYLMIPLLGPSNPRDVLGLGANILLDPTNLIPMKQHVWWAAFRQYMVLVDLRSRTLDTLEDVERNSVDYYASLRNLYRQARREQIRNGHQRPMDGLPDL